MYNAYKKVVSKFEEDHPGWKVEMEPYQWADMRTKLLANFTSHSVPDLVEEPGGWVQEFSRAGKLLSLQQFVNADGKSIGYPDDWQTYAVERNRINGQVYGIQLHLTCVLCIYNQDMFDKTGIKQAPKTWDEFLTMAKELTRDGVYGVGLNKQSANAWPWFLQNEVKYYDPASNSIPMDNDAAYEALQFQSDIIHKYKYSPLPPVVNSSQGPQQLFSAGKVAFILTGPWDIKTIQTSSPNIHWNISQALKKKVQTTNTGGTSLMIPKDAKNPDMAWELTKRLTTLDVEIAVAKEASLTMPRKSWGTHPEIKGLERIAPFAEGLNYAQSASAQLDLTGKSGTIADLLDKAYQDVIYRNVSVSQALKDFVAAGNKVLQA